MGQKHHKKYTRHTRRKRTMKSVIPETVLPDAEIPTADPKKSWFSALKQPKVFIPLAIFIILYVALNIWVFFYGTKIFGPKTGKLVSRMTVAQPQVSTPTQFATPASIPTATHTPIKLKPDNGTEGTYSVSQTKHVGPTVTQVIFDPLDVQNGQTLVITATLKNDVAITEVKGTLQMDHGQQNATFSRIDGTDTNGSWQGKFKLNDTVLYKYILTITASAGNGTSTAIVAPRS